MSATLFTSEARKTPQSEKHDSLNQWSIVSGGGASSRNLILKTARAPTKATTYTQAACTGAAQPTRRANANQTTPTLWCKFMYAKYYSSRVKFQADYGGIPCPRSGNRTDNQSSQNPLLLRGSRDDRSEPRAVHLVRRRHASCLYALRTRISKEN